MSGTGNPEVGGPGVGVMAETGPSKGRFELIGADATVAAGLIGSGGGSERLCIHEVELPALDALRPPWTLRFHRCGEVEEVPLATLPRRVVPARTTGCCST